MPDTLRDQRVQLGCGTLIVIAIIVMFFSRGGTQEIEAQIGGLRSEVVELKRLIEQQSADIRQLREKLAPPSPKSSIEKSKE